MELPPRKRMPQLGTKAADVEELDDRYKNEKDTAIESTIQLRESLESDGLADRHEQMQPPRPEVNEEMIGLEIEQLWMFEETDGSKVPQWCKSLIVTVKSRNRVHIKWSANCLREGDLGITEEVLIKSMFNTHVEGGWRMSLE